MNMQRQEDYIPKTKLKVISGGKDDGVQPPSSNWLRDLPKHTVFLCQEQGNKVGVFLWFVVFKFTHAVLLGSNVQGEHKLIVNDIEFCKRNTLLEIIEFGKEEDLETGTETLYIENGNSDTSIPRGLAVNADDEKG